MTKTGPELIEEISKYPSLDLLLDRSPFARPPSLEEFVQQIERMRLERSLATIKDQERKDKKREKESEE